MFKVGDKVKFKGNTTVHTIESHSQEEYGLRSEGKYFCYFSTKFIEKHCELVKESKMDTIKIRKWEELDGKISPSKEFIISTIDECITINNYEEEEEFPENVANIDTREAGELYTFAFLKAFGFNVEFIPEIKLTEQEWHFVRAFKEGWIARDKNGTIWLFEGEAYKSAANDDEWLRVDRKEHYPIKMSMFKFIKWEDEEPWSIESLMKLDKEERQCQMN